MSRFILIDDPNSILTNQISSFYSVKNVTKLNDVVLLYLDNTNLAELVPTIKALALDLMTNNKIYISGNKNNLEEEVKLVLTNLKKLDKGIFLAPDLVKYLDDKRSALSVILGDYYNNHNFLTLLNTFFKNNLNVLVTANNLYMHRNTLLYKINNFYEHTGFNIKSFRDSALLYIYLGLDLS